jgi:hypothetical protein
VAIIDINETEQQIMVFALKVMMNALYANKQYMQACGVMSEDRFIDDLGVAFMLRHRLKELFNGNHS